MKDKRFIYVFEFSDNSVYIGLTYDVKKREYNHLTEKSSTVYKHIKETGADYKLIIINEKGLSLDEAQKLEDDTKTMYLKKGYTILNCRIIWTFDKCTIEAIKYTTRFDFQKNSNGAYTSARKNSWLEGICKHMKIVKKPIGYWTEEMLKKEAKKYKNRKDFHKGNGSAYTTAIKKGVLDKICFNTSLPINTWTKEKCNAEARRYTNIKDFKKYSYGAYLAATKNDWVVSIIKHLNK